MLKLFRLEINFLSSKHTNEIKIFLAKLKYTAVGAFAMRFNLDIEHFLLHTTVVLTTVAVGTCYCYKRSSLSSKDLGFNSRF